ncbi:response regulator [Rickettsiales endosymbiont of Stachyamoeba lipophora]|uniref:response regulator n=1 Tax=Rickettsiales endosymbiont of Stachyamoeba lipophora TaxID=2486578 RepID=UPI0013DE5632|nr:response regulator [Rickettsiales endosymbiont of Stachyamoeba lipophora]
MVNCELLNYLCNKLNCSVIILKHPDNILFHLNNQLSVEPQLLAKIKEHTEKNYSGILYDEFKEIKLFCIKLPLFTRLRFYLAIVSHTSSQDIIRHFIDKIQLPCFITVNNIIKYYNNSFGQTITSQLGTPLEQTFDSYFQHHIIKIMDELYFRQDDLLLHFINIPIGNVHYHLMLHASYHNVLSDIVKVPTSPTIIMDLNQNIIIGNESFSKAYPKTNHGSDLFDEQSWKKIYNFANSEQQYLEINFSPNSQLFCYNLKKIFSYQIIKNKIYIIIKDTTHNKLNLDNQLVHSQKLQAVGQLAGGIAHDFNNLLTAMLGFCDLLLLKHPPGDKSFPEIMQIKQNANRAANLVRQLLAFSRKQTLNLEMVDVTIIIDELANMITRLIGENVQLSIYHGKNLWVTKADHGQLEQVIVNLAVNARDAMNRKGALSIRSENININKSGGLGSEYTSPTEEDIILPGEYIKISIKDSGTGIAKHQIPKIFEPFYSTKEMGAGTGLGLATVYGIIKQFGGYIYVKSNLGEGSEFCLFLKREDNIITQIEDIKTSYIQHEDLTGSETIMLVEDEEAVRIFSSEALARKGYQVFEASSGDHALEILAEHGQNIDLIITDVMMPGINGPEMIQQVTRQFPKIKVIFTSGYGEDIFEEQFGKKRDFNFLPKPYSLKQLVEKVKQVL